MSLNIGEPGASGSQMGQIHDDRQNGRKPAPGDGSTRISAACPVRYSAGFPGFGEQHGNISGGRLHPGGSFNDENVLVRDEGSPWPVELFIPDLRQGAKYSPDEDLDFVRGCRFAGGPSSADTAPAGRMAG